MPGQAPHRPVPGRRPASRAARPRRREPRFRIDQPPGVGPRLPRRHALAREHHRLPPLLAPGVDPRSRVGRSGDRQGAAHRPADGVAAAGRRTAPTSRRRQPPPATGQIIQPVGEGLRRIASSAASRLTAWPRSRRPATDGAVRIAGGAASCLPAVVRRPNTCALLASRQAGMLRPAGRSRPPGPLGVRRRPSERGAPRGSTAG